MLPKLTLQPLVENAFIHGFAGRDDHNCLEITGHFTSESEDEYTIKVSDNGIGMTEETLIKFNNGDLATDAAHVGLSNVISRLHYLYKDRVTVTVNSEYGFGTSIIIVLALNQGVGADESDNH